MYEATKKKQIYIMNVFKWSNGKAAIGDCPPPSHVMTEGEDINMTKEKKDVKWGRLLLGNCYDPPEMSVSDMEGDPASNTHLYICCKSAISACHCLSIYVIVFNSHTQSLKHERLIRNTHHNNHVTFEYI